MTGEAGPLLAVEDLSIEFRTREGIVRALEQASFTMGQAETVGVVGESGSGKTITAHAVMGVLHPAGRVTGGSVRFRGADLLALGEEERRGYCGRKMAIAFQNARSALNPIRPVGRQIEDVLLRHTDLGRSAARDRALELFARVQIPDPPRLHRAYPFELSGGMCQRVMIALAVAGSPALLIADEPATGLDVATQCAVLELIEELAHENRMAMLLISHDLGLVGERADRVVVMHAGHVVEIAPSAELFAAPRHPYTAQLLATTPHPDSRLADLRPIPGSVPDLREALPPCRYRYRCERAAPECDEPPLPRVEITPGHFVACRRPL